MPTSHFNQLNEIVELIVLTNPKSILDVGVGFGKYGFLSREYLELWNSNKYNNWQRQIDGIEVFKDYLTPVHDFIYNHIYIGDAINILPTLTTYYDLILLIDVLEHFNYQNGIKLLTECKKRSRNLIISTPKNIGSQTVSFGNPFETHKFQWRNTYFDDFHEKFFISNEYSIICFIGKDSHIVKHIRNKLRVRSFLKRPFRVLKGLSNIL
jgi:hypothetical protein